MIRTKDTGNRKMMFTSFIALLLAISISVTGCTSQYGTTNEYRTGYQGMTLEFSRSNPQSVYEQEEFGTSVFIKNAGAYDVDMDNPARLIVSYDTYRLSTEDAQGSVELTDIYLKGKSKYYPIGEDFPFDLYFTSNSLTHLRESSETEISYNLCYPYMTELTTMMCIDTKTATRDDSAAACKSQTYTDRNGQGAPIAITRIEPEIQLQAGYVRPQFKIYIENLGGGYVSSSMGCYEKGDDTLASGKVNVRAMLSQNRELQCGPIESREMLKLKDSETFIRCYLPENSRGYDAKDKSYTTPLTIKLYYTYQTIQSEKIEILRNDVLTPDVNQGLCASYQVEFAGKCLTKCEYCSKNPGDPICNENKPSYNGFSFTSSFSCSCSITECNSKIGTGSCIKGYCPGDLYCCSANQCDQYQVEYKGECIDKCQYCADTTHPADETICDAFDFTGFSCIGIDAKQCEEYASSGACIKGYCGGENINAFCANTAKVPLGLPTGNLISGNLVDDTLSDTVSQADMNEAKVIQSGMDRCDYCSQDLSGNDACIFSNAGIFGRISDTFSCACTDDDSKKMKTYQFDPDKGACSNDMFCCDLMGLEYS